MTLSFNCVTDDVIEAAKRLAVTDMVSKKKKRCPPNWGEFASPRFI